MPVLPTLSGREVVRVFEKFGWTAMRQSGSHIVRTKDGELASLSVPGVIPGYGRFKPAGRDAGSPRRTADRDAVG